MPKMWWLLKFASDLARSDSRTSTCTIRLAYVRLRTVAGGPCQNARLAKAYSGNNFLVRDPHSKPARAVDKDTIHDAETHSIFRVCSAYRITKFDNSQSRTLLYSYEQQLERQRSQLSILTGNLDDGLTVFVSWRFVQLYSWPGT